MQLCFFPFFLNHLPGFESSNIWVFPNIGVPQNGWSIIENPIEIDDLGVPLFLETSKYVFYIVNPKRISNIPWRYGDHNMVFKSRLL